MVTFTAHRLVTLASIGMLLGACTAVRVEDVPSTTAIDMAAAKVQDSLLIPPGMDEVPASEPDFVESSETVDPEVSAPLQTNATWTVQYRDNGFDAENAAGDTCSGWLAYGEAVPQQGQSIKMACSDGRLAKLEIGTGEGNTRAGAVVFGETSETAFIKSD